MSARLSLITGTASTLSHTTISGSMRFNFETISSTPTSPASTPPLNWRKRPCASATATRAPAARNCATADSIAGIGASSRSPLCWCEASAISSAIAMSPGAIAARRSSQPRVSLKPTAGGSSWPFTSKPLVVVAWSLAASRLAYPSSAANCSMASLMSAGGLQPGPVVFFRRLRAPRLRSTLSTKRVSPSRRAWTGIISSICGARRARARSTGRVSSTAVKG